MVTGCTSASSPETTCGAEFCPASSHTTVCALCSLSESWVATRMRGWRRRLRWRSTAAAPCRSRPRGPSAASPARGRAHLATSASSAACRSRASATAAAAEPRRQMVRGARGMQQTARLLTTTLPTTPYAVCGGCRANLALILSMSVRGPQRMKVQSLCRHGIVLSAHGQH